MSSWAALPGAARQVLKTTSVVVPPTVVRSLKTITGCLLVFRETLFTSYVITAAPAGTMFAAARVAALMLALPELLQGLASVQVQGAKAVQLMALVPVPCVPEVAWPEVTGRKRLPGSGGARGKWMAAM